MSKKIEFKVGDETFTIVGDYISKKKLFEIAGLEESEWDVEVCYEGGFVKMLNDFSYYKLTHPQFKKFQKVLKNRDI